MVGSPPAHILCVVTGGSRKQIGKALGFAGRAVSWADGCAEGMRLLSRSDPDVIVLQSSLVGTREAADLTAAAEVRSIPVVVMGRGGSDAQVDLAGSLARAAGLLGQGERADDRGQLDAGDVIIDISGRRARVDGHPVPLTEKEFELLRNLVQRPGWTWSRQQLLEQVWGYQYADPRVVTVHIGNLRKKLAEAASGSSDSEHPPGGSSREAFIQTVRGVGYRFSCPDDPEDGRDRAHRSPAPRDEPTPARGHSGHLPFVGRDREMALLVERFEEVIDGHMGAAVLVGDAGIGKTRLAEEFSQRVRQRGGTVLWGRCHHSTLGPVYGPWTEILAHWGGTGRPEPAKGPHARLQFYEDLTLAMRAHVERPTCLVMDNLQWAGHPALLALRHVMLRTQDAPLMFVLTHRPFDASTNRPLNDVIADITRGGWGPILPLSPLTSDEVETLVHELAQTDASACSLVDMGAAMYELTEGNPLFLVQLVLLLQLRAVNGRVDLADLRLSREEGVRSVILQNVSRVSPACREWLRLAAVFGRESNAAVVGEAAGLSAEQVSDLMAEATEARLLSPSDDAPERCRFAHGLIRDVVYEELSPDRRAHLHALAGATVERLGSGELDLHCRMLAHHYSEAVPVGFAVKALEYCLHVARVAAAHHAWEEACTNWERGLSLLELLPEGAAERGMIAVGPVCEDLGDALALLGQGHRAAGAYERAILHVAPDEKAALARLKRKRARCGEVC